MAGFFFPVQGNARREYNAHRYGEVTQPRVWGYVEVRDEYGDIVFDGDEPLLQRVITANPNQLRFDIVPGFSTGHMHLWRYSFIIRIGTQDIRVWGLTRRWYSAEAVQNMRIHFAVDGDGFPAFNYDGGERETTEIRHGVDADGQPVYRTHYQIEARESGYFAHRPNAPGFAGPVFLLIIGLALLSVVVYNLFFVFYYKSIDKHGIFAYAVIESASSSRFGSKRWLSVRYKYQVEDEWVEASSPYTFRPLEVEYFKSLDAITIKYRGSKSIITEKMITRARIDPPF